MFTLILAAAGAFPGADASVYAAIGADRPAPAVAAAPVKTASTWKVVFVNTPLVELGLPDCVCERDDSRQLPLTFATGIYITGPDTANFMADTVYPRVLSQYVRQLMTSKETVTTKAVAKPAATSAPVYNNSQDGCADGSCSSPAYRNSRPGFFRR